jgi:hypothetical protein
MADTGSDGQVVGKVRVLTRDNYPRWRDEMEDILWSQGLWEYASGETKAPEVPAVGQEGRDAAIKKLREWQVKDSGARALIKRSLDDQTFSHVQDCKSSAEILMRIKTLRDPRTTDALMTEVTAFFEDKWKDGDDVSSYMARVCSLATRVNNMGDADVKLTDKILMGKVLGSLPFSYMAFKSSWYLMSERNPSLEVFKEKLLTYERGLRGHESRAEHEWTRADPGEDALHVRGKRRNKAAGSQEFSGKCFKCKKFGHKKPDCPELDQDDRRKEMAGFVSECALSAVTHADPGDIICDSGASRHMTGQRWWFKSLVPLKFPIKVRTAVDIITATHVGDVGVMVKRDGQHWVKSVWKDVLFVPGLTFSLFSTVYMAWHEGCSFMHEGGKAWIMRDGDVVFRGSQRNGSLVMDMMVTARGMNKALVETGKLRMEVRAGLQDQTAVNAAVVEMQTEMSGRGTDRGSPLVTWSKDGMVQAQRRITIHEGCEKGQAVRHYRGTRVSNSTTRASRSSTGDLVVSGQKVDAVAQQRIRQQDDHGQHVQHRSCCGSEEVVDSLTPLLTRGSDVKSILKLNEKKLLHVPGDRIMDTVTASIPDDNWSGCCSHLTQSSHVAARSKKKKVRFKDSDVVAPDHSDVDIMFIDARTH